MFIEWWPLKCKPKLTRVQQKQRLQGLVLKESEIGEWHSTKDDFAQNIWAEEIVKLVAEVGDLDGVLVHCVLENTPPTLKAHLAGDYNSWDDFLKAVYAIPQDCLQTEKRHQKEEKAHDQAIASLQQQLAQLSLPPPHGTRQFTAQPTGPTIPTTMAAYTSTANVVTQPNPRPYTGHGGIPQCTTLTQAQILECANSIPQCPNTEEGHQQIPNLMYTYVCTVTVGPGRNDRRPGDKGFVD